MILLIPGEGHRQIWRITGKTTSQQHVAMVWPAVMATLKRRKLKWQDMCAAECPVQTYVLSWVMLGWHMGWSFNVTWWRSYLYMISLLNEVQGSERRCRSVPHLHRDFSLHGFPVQELQDLVFSQDGHRDNLPPSMSQARGALYINWGSSSRIDVGGIARRKLSTFKYLHIVSLNL